VRDGKAQVGELAGSLFFAFPFVEVLRVEVLRVDDVRDVVRPERLQRRRRADVPDEERAAAGEAEDGRDVLVEAARPGLIAQPIPGRGDDGGSVGDARGGPRWRRFRNVTRVSVVRVDARVVSRGRARSIRVDADASPRAERRFVGRGCLARASPHGEKISLAVVVGGGAVAGGDIVKSEGRRYRAGTYARSLTPSAW
jgi:hypothetical protein